VLTAPWIADRSGDQNAIVSRRRAPRVYVTDSTGDVFMRGVAAGSVSHDIRGAVLKLVASHPADEVVVGHAPSGELIRLVRLLGEGRPCYALFIETLATRSPIDAACTRYALSERERDVLPHLLRGTSTAEIAAELMIAESTVATHVRNIGAKMNASKRKEIVATVLGGR
jgi:DNA-binding NarL/FixJ family response regulator